MMFSFGILLFGSLVTMSLFLQTVLGYTAESAGFVLSGCGFVVLLAMPIVGQLTTRIQVRCIVAFGWFCLAIAMYYSTWRIDLLISFSSASWLRVAQSVGLGFLFVPITLAAYIGMPAEKSNSVAGMINFMRNIGSSVGTSIVTTVVARRSQICFGFSPLARQSCSCCLFFSRRMTQASAVRQRWVKRGRKVMTLIATTLPELGGSKNRDGAFLGRVSP